MWIPHKLLSPLKAESPRETIQASEAATDDRTFVVGFLLGNAVTKVWETDLLVAPTDARREIRLDGKSCVIDASANISGKLHEIIYTIPSTGAVAALSTTFQHVAGELDRMALQYGRSVEIAGWRIADVEHGARWRCVPFRPSALLAEQDPGTLPPAYAEVLRLYREARNATSAAWRLISAGAILDAAVSRRQPFVSKELDLANFTITTDMLVRSGTLATHPELKGATARVLRDLVETPRQALLSELTALTGNANAPVTRSYRDAAAFAALANLVDLVARDIVLTSLRASGCFQIPEPVENAEPVSV